LSAEVLAGGEEGMALLELVLPDRHSGGPTIPFKASWWAVEPPLTTPVDVHAFQELWFVASGAGSMRLGEEQFEIRAGQTVYIPAGIEHQVGSLGPDIFEAFSVWWL
jgi:mannose-6-phosphate isomerase-like protein (cupin superfamily)